MELGVGEALVSCLDEKGIPTVVERARILPPQSLMGPGDAGQIQSLIISDEFDIKYREAVDRESAYEILIKATKELEQRKLEEEEEKKRLKEEEAARKAAEKEAAAAEKQRLKEEETARKAAEREAAAAEKQRLKEEEAARKAAEKEALAAQKAAEKEALAAQKAAEKEALAAQKAAEKEAEAKKKVFQKAANSAASSVVNAVGTNLVNAATGGKTTDSGTIAKRAASSALKSVMKSGSDAILRGLFKVKK